MFWGFLLCSFITYVTCQSGYPVFKPSFERVIIFVNQSTEVNCIAIGEKPVTYTWRNNVGDPIPSNPTQRMFTRSAEVGSVLVIKSPDKYDEGSYSCSAQNSHGTNTKVFAISVNETSDYYERNETVDIRNIHVVNVTERSVEFVIEASGNVTEVVVHYREKKGSQDYRKKIFTSGTKTVIEDLLPGREYTFYFQIDQSTISNDTSLDVAMLPAQPEVIFRSVTESTLQIEWFRSIDDIMRGAIDEYRLTYVGQQMEKGNYWRPSGCEVEIKIKTNSCYSRYTIAGLYSGSYYEIQLAAHTASGYGKPYRNKVHMP